MHVTYFRGTLVDSNSSTLLLCFGSKSSRTGLSDEGIQQTSIRLLLEKKSSKI